MLVEEAHDLISAHSTDVNAVFTFASGGFDRLLGMDPSVRIAFELYLHVLLELVAIFRSKGGMILLCSCVLRQSRSVSLYAYRCFSLTCPDPGRRRPRLGLVGHCTRDENSSRFCSFPDFPLMLAN